MKKLHLTTLGCAKNLVDSEVILGKLKNDYEIVESAEEAEVIILNTCGFIQSAKEESIDAILQAERLKKEGNCKNLIVAGCLSGRYKNEMKKELPEVDAFFGTQEFDKIAKYLNAKTNGRNLQHNDPYQERNLTTPPHFAYLKISEGCDHKCGFCAIPLIRGKHISRPIEDIVQEATKLTNRGVKEIILISQDTTYYGRDLYGKVMLIELLKELIKIKDLKWIRLLYLYPAEFKFELLDLIAGEEKLCKYFDMPLQHISDKMLKQMRRGTTKKRTVELIEQVRKKLPESAFRTTFVAGYPGETEEDFEELVKFVEETEFDRLGVFTYSLEENTHSYSLPNHLPEKVKQQRKNKIMEIQKDISLRKNQNYIGKKIEVLIDRVEEDEFVGRTQFDAPEVDNEVWIKQKDGRLKIKDERLKMEDGKWEMEDGNMKNERKIEIGNFYNVRIEDATEYDLIGIFSIM